MDGNYYVTSILEDCEWKVISTIDQNEFAKTADIPYAIAVSAVIFLALILLFVFLFPLLIKISKQITRLDGAIKEMSGGNLDATVELHGVQELSLIHICGKNLGKLLYSADRDLNSSYRCASYLEPRFSYGVWRQ